MTDVLRQLCERLAMVAIDAPRPDGISLHGDISRALAADPGLAALVEIVEKWTRIDDGAAGNQPCDCKRCNDFRAALKLAATGEPP